MPFKEFDRRTAATSKSPFVTIQRKGPFGFNSAAYEALGKPEAVTLLYDEEERLIGFKPVDLRNPRAFPIRAQGPNLKSYIVAGQAFSNYHGLDTSVARRYPVEMRDGILVLDLKADSVDVTGPRAANRSRHASSNLNEQENLLEA